MAYVRRYLSGQAATTVVIAEGAITTDKIVDKAVTQPKVADDAITSDKIAPGAVETTDIKDGEVKTADLASGAVTTEKIADQAVTVAKLESAIQGISRPLTPGVATAEIADSAVTEGKLADNSVGTAKVKDGNISAVKLAVNSVEQAKIKDGAVSAAKIAGGAVDQTKIAVNAVTGSEIQAGAVSASELAVNAVEETRIKDAAVSTNKIKSRNVTTDRIGFKQVTFEEIADETITPGNVADNVIPLRAWEYIRTHIYEFFDDFLGPFLKSAWREIGDPGGFVSFPASRQGVARIATGAVTGNKYRIDFEDIQQIEMPTVKPKMVVLKDAFNVNNYIEVIIGLYRDSDNYVAFRATDIAGATPNWYAVCRSGGVETAVDTTKAISSVTQKLKIDYVSSSLVKFYEGDLLVASIDSNIPVGKADPFLSIETKANAERNGTFDYVVLTGNRSYA